MNPGQAPFNPQLVLAIIKGFNMVHYVRQSECHRKARFNILQLPYDNVINEMHSFSQKDPTVVEESMEGR